MEISDSELPCPKLQHSITLLKPRGKIVRHVENVINVPLLGIALVSGSRLAVKFSQQQDKPADTHWSERPPDIPARTGCSLATAAGGSDVISPNRPCRGATSR